MKPTDRQDDEKEEKSESKIFTKPVLTVKPISDLTHDVYAGWASCSYPYHGFPYVNT